MDTMPMTGGAAMSMAWMPMCGQSWMGAAASFVGMWSLMMAAMMLPSLVPSLWRYRREVGRAGELASVLLTLVVAGGYFLVWTLIGAVIYPLGAATMAVTMRYPVLAGGVPIAIGMVVLGAGVLQFTRWKAHHLACSRNDCRRGLLPCGQASPVTPMTAVRDGVRLGFHCSQCCAGLTAALLVAGIMDWPVMLAVTVAINLERLAPAGERVAQLIGAVVIGAGLLVIVRAAAGL